MTVEAAQRRVEDFLTHQLLEVFRATEYALPSFDAEPQEVALADAGRSQVELRHVRGASSTGAPTSSR